MIEKGERIIIPVSQLEYTEGGNTICIQGLKGTTVLRIQARFHHINSTMCQANPSSHADIVVESDINFCLHQDDVP